MANIQIPNLPVAVGLSGTEQIEIVQAGTSRRTSVQAIVNYGNPIPYASYATTYQFMLALAATPGIDPNLLYQALPADFSNEATVQFYCSPYVRPDSPLALLCEATYPGIDMDAVFGLAQFQMQWG